MILFFGLGILSNCYMLPIDEQPNLSIIKIIGHRGAAGLSPENTIPSIRLALKYEADRIEIDVRQTKDDIVVLMHDKKLDRTTNGKGELGNLSYEELKKLTIKSNTEKDIKVPTLKEVIDIVKNTQSELLIEVKAGDEKYPNIEKNILAILADSEFPIERTIIQSFNNDILKRFHGLNPTLRLHKLMLTGFFFRPKKYPHIEEFTINYLFLTKGKVSKVHNLNKKINVWTVDDEKTMRKMIKLGVDGIITNFPNKLNTVSQR